MKKIIAPSLLAANFGNLAADLAELKNSSAQWLHLDIMDGVFVPNISFGLPIIEAVKKQSTLFLDVHLMIVHPEKYFEAFAKVGAQSITFHFEASVHLHRHLQMIKDLGCKAGIALNPATPIEVLKEVLGQIDLICLMAVNPGFGGQKFIPHTFEKITTLKKLLHEKNSSALIQIDGGINQENCGLLWQKGMNVAVAGSSIFQAASIPKAIEDLLKAS